MTDWSKEQDVLKLCLALHMHHTGSGDVLSDRDLECVRSFLQRKLDNWSRSVGRGYLFDEAVRMLIVATLAEQTL